MPAALTLALEYAVHWREAGCASSAASVMARFACGCCGCDGAFIRRRDHETCLDRLARASRFSREDSALGGWKGRVRRNPVVLGGPFSSRWHLTARSDKSGFNDRVREESHAGATVRGVDSHDEIIGERGGPSSSEPGGRARRGCAELGEKIAEAGTESSPTTGATRRFEHRDRGGRRRDDGSRICTNCGRPRCASAYIGGSSRADEGDDPGLAGRRRCARPLCGA